MRKFHRGERGTALIIVFVVTLLLLSMAMSVYMVTSNRVRGTTATERGERALATCEAALALAIDSFRKGNYPTTSTTTNGSLGDSTYTIMAINVGAGNYKIIVTSPSASSITDNGDGTYKIIANSSNTVTWDAQGRAIEAFVSGQTYHPFLNYAIFAGNKTNSSYHFDFGGYKTYTYTTQTPGHTVSTTTTSYTNTITATTPLPTPNPQVTTTVTSGYTQTVSAFYTKQGPSSGKYRWKIDTTTDTVYAPVLDTTSDSRDTVSGDVYINGSSHFYYADQGTPESGTVLQGGATITGAHVDVTGSITRYNGTPLGGATAAGAVSSNSTFVTGNANGGFSTVIPPPDLQGAGYTSMALAAKTAPSGTLNGVVYVDGPNSALNTSKTMSGQESGANNFCYTASSSNALASIFAKGVLSGSSNPYVAMGPKINANGGTTNENYFLGDWWETSTGQTITITPSQNNKTYYVPGNLWLETNGAGPQIKTTDGSPVRITIVAAGNVYLCDQLLHSDYPASASQMPGTSTYAYNATPNKDAIALIAMASPPNGAVTSDSYTDNNDNGKWDPGEPIIKADGTVENTTAATPSNYFKGPKEGTGNIYFGDPTIGPVGFMGAFLYAQNNFDDYALEKINGLDQPQEIGIYGTMSAGNAIRVKRDFSNANTGNVPYHARMTVRYDPRLQSGSVKLPNMPNQATGMTTGGVSLLSWRELAVR
ncbi:MAG: hypothetical protein KIS92_05570 [Planctomycetota bacterium]|nr:hypothetical protein [Planctomycetota bacterium]